MRRFHQEHSRCSTMGVDYSHAHSKIVGKLGGFYPQILRCFFSVFGIDRQ